MMGRTLAIPIYKALLCFVIHITQTTYISDISSSGTESDGEKGFSLGAAEARKLLWVL